MMRAPWLGLFGRQLVRDVLRNAIIALSAGLALFISVDFVEAGNLVKEDAPLSLLLSLQLYNLPLVIQQIGPLAAVIGATTATAALLRRGEVVAMLAAGAPPTFLLKPALIAGIGLALAQGGLTEWIVPPARVEVSALRRELGLPVKEPELRRHQTWFRGKTEIYRVHDMEDQEGRVLAGVTILDIQKGRLRDRWDVKRLVHRAGRWIGEEILHRKIEGEQLVTSRVATSVLDLGESPDDFVNSIGSPDRMQYGALKAAVDARERLGQPVIEHRLELYRRHAQPLTLWLSLMLAVAVALRISRKPTLAGALGAGAAVGFVLWILDEVGLALGSTSALPPEPAAHAGLALVAVTAAMAWIRAFQRGVAD